MVERTVTEAAVLQEGGRQWRREVSLRLAKQQRILEQQARLSAARHAMQCSRGVSTAPTPAPQTHLST